MFRLFASLLAFFALPLHAEEPLAPGDLVALEVLPGWETSRGTVMTGLRLRLAPGWKTYWRSPGEAGIPPQFSWTGSDNVTSTGFLWPVPEVFETSGYRSIGYHDEVVIPLELTPTHAGAPVYLAGQVDLGVCDEICVPVSLDFAADLKVDDRRDPAIVAALVDQPITAAEAGVTGLQCSFTPEAEGMRVTAAIELPRTGGEEVVVIEAGQPGLWVSPAQSWREGGVLTATAMIVATGGAALALDREHLRLTVIADGRAVDLRGCPGGGG